jgi:hypothetical protein
MQLGLISYVRNARGVHGFHRGRDNPPALLAADT